MANKAKWLAWGYALITALDQSIQAHGIPTHPHEWVPILTATILALAVHKAASTDGSK